MSGPELKAGDSAKVYEDRVAELRSCKPGFSFCLTRHAIEDLGENLDLTLDFSHAWIIDSTTENIVIVRLPDSVEAASRILKLGDMSTEFEAGDVVTLKSGGPRMTVMCLEPGGLLFVSWFDGYTIKGERFEPATLGLYSPPDFAPQSQ